MEKKYNLDFCFKGQRDYVQGPDILETALNILCKDFTDIFNIKYAAHRWIRNNANMRVSEKEEDNKGDSIITFNSGLKEYIANINDNLQPIVDRKPYSEDIIVQESTISNKEIKFRNTLDYSLSEIIVSMNKHFLQQETKILQKWIVTKIEYNRILGRPEFLMKNISIILQNNLNNKLTKSSVLIENERIGFIYFSLV